MDKDHHHCNKSVGGRGNEGSDGPSAGAERGAEDTSDSGNEFSMGASRRRDSDTLSKNGDDHQCHHHCEADTGDQNGGGGGSGESDAPRQSSGAGTGTGSLHLHHHHHHTSESIDVDKGNELSKNGSSSEGDSMSHHRGEHSPNTHHYHHQDSLLGPAMLENSAAVFQPFTGSLFDTPPLMLSSPHQLQQSQQQQQHQFQGFSSPSGFPLGLHNDVFPCVVLCQRCARNLPFISCLVCHAALCALCIQFHPCILEANMRTYMDLRQRMTALMPRAVPSQQQHHQQQQTQQVSSKRPRMKFTDFQKEELERLYKEKNYPNKADLVQLEQTSAIPYKSSFYWMGNKRRSEREAEKEEELKPGMMRPKKPKIPLESCSSCKKEEVPRSPPPPPPPSTFHKIATMI